MGFAYVQVKASTAMHLNLLLCEPTGSAGWINILADLAGVDAVDRIFDAATFRVPYLWLDDESCLEQMWEAAQADGGRIWFDELGKLRFENAGHWLTAPHTTRP
jgi:hypothetical protein